MIKEVLAANPIVNPLVQSSLQPVAFISRLLSTLINLAFLAGAVFFFFVLIMGAISWIGAGGDKGKLEDAKGKITSALIGIVVLFGIYAALSILQNFLGVQLLTFTIYNITGNSIGTIDLSPTGQFSSLSGITLQSLVSSIITIALVIGALIFMFMLISGGIMWIASGGDKMKLEEAKQRIEHALIGIVILFSVWGIATLVGIFFGVKILTFNTGSPPTPPGGPSIIPSATPFPTATPTPPGGGTVPPWCNQVCPPSCPSGTCFNGVCRNTSCTSDSDCLCTVNVTCQQACDQANPNNTGSMCGSSNQTVRAPAGDSYCLATTGSALPCSCAVPLPTATPAPGTCYSGCTSNAQCTTTGLTCDLSINRCVNSQCVSDSSCSCQNPLNTWNITVSPVCANGNTPVGSGTIRWIEFIPPTPLQSVKTFNFAGSSQTVTLTSYAPASERLDLEAFLGTPLNLSGSSPDPRIIYEPQDALWYTGGAFGGTTLPNGNYTIQFQAPTAWCNVPTPPPGAALQLTWVANYPAYFPTGTNNFYLKAKVTDNLNNPVDGANVILTNTVYSGQLLMGLGNGLYGDPSTSGLCWTRFTSGQTFVALQATKAGYTTATLTGLTTATAVSGCP